MTSLNYLGIFCLFWLTINISTMNAIHLDETQLISLIGPGYKNESQLFLDHKQLTSISSNAFANLVKVNYLTLDFNSLTSLEPNTFSSLVNLERLSIQTNKLSSIDSVSLFGSLVNLKILNLSWNNLISFDRNSFLGLVNLEKVYMGSNPITLTQPSYVLKLCSPSVNPKCTIYL